MGYIPEAPTGADRPGPERNGAERTHDFVTRSPLIILHDPSFVENLFLTPPMAVTSNPVVQSTGIYG